MSSADTRENGFHPHADLRAFYSGIQVEPLTSYDDQLIAAAMLGVQMCKLGEEIGEVEAAHRLKEDRMHIAEEAIDVAYVAVGVNYLLDRETYLAPHEDDTSVATLLREHVGVQDAHLEDDKDRMSGHLSALANVSFGLVRALGYDPEELWSYKHIINTTKYDGGLYATLRQDGLSHIEAIDALKASWPDRLLALDHATLPIDISNGHLVV